MVTVSQSDLMYVISTSTDYTYNNLQIIVDILNLCSKICGDYEDHKEKENISFLSDEERSSE